MRTDARSSIDRWLTRPLCRRYSGVVFSSTLTTHLVGRECEPGVICWALGSLITDEAEILGVWQSHAGAPVATASVFGELHERGAEFIRFGIGDLAGVQPEFKQIYKTGELVESVEQALENVGALVPPRHRLDVLSFLRATVDAESLAEGRSLLTGFQDSALGKRYPGVVRRWEEALASFEPVYSLHAQLRGLVRSADRTAADVRGRLTRAIHRHGPFINSAAALDFVATTLARTELQLDRDRAAAVAAREADSATLRRVIPMSGALGVPTLA